MDCTDIVTCPGCGRAKRTHHLCPHCYSELSRGFKTAARQEARQQQQQQVASTSKLPPSSGSSNTSPETHSVPHWARNRGGAVPLQPGETLTKWMRARAGLRKEDPKAHLGQDGKSVDVRGSRSSRDKDDNDDQPPSLPPGMQFA